MSDCTALVISGPTGPTGISGSAGPAGSTGAQGPTGSAAPSGMLFAGGTVSLTAGVDTSISFSFPTACLGVVLTGDGGPLPDVFLISKSASGAVVNSGGVTASASWLAFGN